MHNFIKNFSVSGRIGLCISLIVVPSGCQSIQKLSTHAPEPTVVILQDLTTEMIQKIHKERHSPSFASKTKMLQKAGLEVDPDKVVKKSTKRGRNSPPPVQEQSLNQSISYFKSYDLKDLTITSEAIDRSTCNFNANAAYAIASHSERYFPNELAKQITDLNYKYAIKCGESETLEQARYRQGLLLIAFANSCAEAIPILDDLQKDTNARPAFKVRATYWIHYCQSLENSGRVEYSDLNLLNQFPLSHHALILVGAARPAPENTAASAEIANQTQSFLAPLELFQETTDTEINPYSLNHTVNDWLWMIEDSFLKSDFRQLARILHAFTQDDFATGRVSATPLEDARILMYVSHFAYLNSQANSDFLPLFQLISKAIHLEPKFRNRDIMSRFFPLAFDELISNSSRENDLDVHLIRALVRQESAFNPMAHSTAGARGLMQVVPSTARRLDRNATKNRLFDPSVNVRVGTKYMRQLIERFGDHRLALAAYNAGSLKVEDWIKRYPTNNLQLLIDLFPYRETREYVASIERNRFWYGLLYPAEPLILRPSLSAGPTLDQRRKSAALSPKQNSKSSNSSR